MQYFSRKSGGQAENRREPTTRIVPTWRLSLMILLICCVVGLWDRVANGELKRLPRPVPAPALDGALSWLNTSAPVTLKDLKGKFVLLDFWTYCCINCMHILPELKRLEQAYPNELVVIGVHSAKFATERDTDNIRQALVRYEIEHPVANDAKMILWKKYSVNVWPSLRVIDPEGQVIAYHQGEITFDELNRFFKSVIPGYRRRKLLDEKPLRFDLERDRMAATPLRFPGKVLADAASGRLFIADSGHNRIVITRLDGTLVDVAGAGGEGAESGSFEQATFDHPQGMALYKGDLFVADTENHLIRKLDLTNRRVTSIAGNGRQARVAPKRVVASPRSAALASPWDLWVDGDNLFIAMAGLHQIWKMDLASRVIGPFAGNAIEDIVDGPLLPRQPYQTGSASFAQPSGLASDGLQLYVADSEGSSIRAVPLGGDRPVTTVIGTSGLSGGRLFTFGDRDGAARQALMQHPIGVAYHDGQLFVADTYNNKVKRIPLEPSPVVETLSLPDGFPLDEPAGLSVANGILYVADTNHHRVLAVELPPGKRIAEVRITGLASPAAASAQPLQQAAERPQTQ